MQRKLQDSFGSPTSSLLVLSIVVENLVHFFRRKVLMKVVIHLGRGGPTAGSDAFHFFQRKQAICGRLLMADAKLRGAVMQNFFSAADHAADVGTDLDVELAPGLRG